MRRYINGDLSICIVARNKDITESHLGKRRDVPMENQPASKNQRVHDLPPAEKNKAWEAGAPIRNMQSDQSASQELNTPSLFSKEEKNLKASEAKKIEAQTKGMSQEEKAEFLQNEVDSRIDNLIKALEERDKRGDLDGVKPLGKDSILYGGAGEPYKRDAGNPQDADASSLEKPNISQDEHVLAAILLRQELRAAKLEREKDVNNVMGAILADTSLSITREFSAMPTQMVSGLLLEFQKNARANSESGMGWAVGIAIVGLVEKAISLPFNQAIKKAQEAEWKFGEKYKEEAPEFLKMLQQEGKNSNKGKTSPKYQGGIDDAETRNKQRYRDVLAFDPDKQGEVGAGAVIGESGNFYTGNQNPSSSRGSGGRDDY